MKKPIFLVVLMLILSIPTVSAQIRIVGTNFDGSSIEDGLFYSQGPVTTDSFFNSWNSSTFEIVPGGPSGSGSALSIKAGNDGIYGKNTNSYQGQTISEATLELAINPISGATVNTGLFYGNDSGSLFGLLIWHNAGRNILRFDGAGDKVLTNGATEYNPLNGKSEFILPVGQWTKITCTYNFTGARGQLKIYVNGVLRAQNLNVVKPATLPVWGAEGGFNLSKKYVGFMDDFALYNYAKTAKDILRDTR